jgi:YD repeat-containing protein
VAFVVRSRLAIALASLAAAGVASPSSAQTTTTYGYDELGQVTTVTRPSGTTTYGYDQAGNRTAVASDHPPPSAQDGALTINAGSSANLELPVSGPIDTVLVDALPAKGTVTIAQRTATYTANVGALGADSFTYHAVGPYGSSAVARVNVTILPPVPTVGGASLVSSYNGSGAVVLPVGGVYTSIGFPSPPAHGQLSLNGATVTYVPTAGYYGVDGFIYNATGPGGTSPAAGVSVTVANPPAPTAGPVSATALRPIAIALAPAGVYTSLSVASGPSYGTVSISGTTATYAPTVGYGGTDSFTYVANGPGGTSAPATVSITVPQNHAPTANPDTGLVHSDGSITINALANDSDPDGDALTVTGASATDGSAYVAAGGTKVGFNAPTVGTRANKTVTITYVISDGRGGSAASTIKVTVQTAYYD